MFLDPGRRKAVRFQKHDCECKDTAVYEDRNKVPMTTSNIIWIFQPNAYL